MSSQSETLVIVDSQGGASSGISCSLSEPAGRGIGTVGGAVDGVPSPVCVDWAPAVEAASIGGEFWSPVESGREAGHMIEAVTTATTTLTASNTRLTADSQG